MPLWNKTDAEASYPKEWNQAQYPGATLVFVDQDEAMNTTNRSKGIKSPGWNVVKEYFDSDGNKRYKVDPLVVFATPQSAAGDAGDDNIVPDVPVTITITSQPTDQTAVAGSATFTIVAEIAPAGTLQYQWQVKRAGTTYYVGIGGANSASYTAHGLISSYNGSTYRCIVSGEGAKAVTSKTALLTVA